MSPSVFKDNCRSAQDWERALRDAIGPWIDAMLEIDDTPTVDAVSERARIVDNFEAMGLKVSGSTKCKQMSWSVTEKFGAVEFERLLDQ